MDRRAPTELDRPVPVPFSCRCRAEVIAVVGSVNNGENIATVGIWLQSAES